MKNRYFLDFESYDYFMERVEDDFKLLDSRYEELNGIIDYSKSTWEIEVVSNNYFVARSIDRLSKRGNFGRVIAKYYELENLMHLTINELDSSFVEQLMRSVVDDQLSLDQNIINLIKSNP